MGARTQRASGVSPGAATSRGALGEDCVPRVLGRLVCKTGTECLPPRAFHRCVVGTEPCTQA